MVQPFTLQFLTEKGPLCIPSTEKMILLLLMRTLTETFLYSWKFFHNSARSHWLLGGHMTSNNETVSQQNL